MSRIDIIGQNGNDGDHYKREDKMANECIFRKPDGVCCEYDKQEHKGLSYKNSDYGFDVEGYCVIDLGDTTATAGNLCTHYDDKDE